jgi:oxygen-independent coproporphyrinogen-3 oxidase
MDDAFAIYVHWPFCVAKCPYCDFNSHVRARVDEAGWRDALLAELDFEAGRTRGRTVTSVFFGGGTPSLMAPETVGAVLERIAARWTLAPGAEVTLEANPNSAEAAKFRALAASGVNRVSIGVQALDDAALRFLGRAHDSGEARRAVAAAQAAFGRVSFDLIYARPGQTPAAWAAELDDALAMAGEHLSLYQLTIEPGTRFAQLAARGDLATPDAEAAAELWETTQERLARAGMPAYEVSNHARPGAESRHNLVYWRYQDHVGVGPGAHGRIGVDGRKRATRRARPA